MSVQAGRYRHYKGNEYIVLGIVAGMKVDDLKELAQWMRSLRSQR